MLKTVKKESTKMEGKGEGQMGGRWGSNDVRSAALGRTKESIESTFFVWRHLQILQFIKNVMIKY